MSKTQYLAQRVEQIETTCHRVLQAQAADQQTALDHVLKIMRVNTAMVLQALQADCATMREAIGQLVECPKVEDHAAIEALQKEAAELRERLEERQAQITQLAEANARLADAEERLREQLAALTPGPGPAAHQPPSTEAPDGALAIGPTESADG